MVITKPTFRFTESTTPAWYKDQEYNLFYLKTVENWANDELQTRGYVFLNRVLETLQLKQVKEGQTVGWVVEPDVRGYIHFDIQPLMGVELGFKLTFNVDGEILDKVKF